MSRSPKPVCKDARMNQRGLWIIGAVASLSLGLAGLGGCGAAYKKTSKGVMDAYRNGQYDHAVPMVNDVAERSTKNQNAILWRLEQGAILRAAEDYEKSNAAFDDAEARANAEAAKGGQAALTEGVAFVSNQGALVYLGYDYDRIMINVYKALNYLNMEMPDAARVELIRALDHQQDAVRENSKRIDAAEKAAAKQKDKYDVEKAKKDPKFQSQIEENYPDIEKFKKYANYVNPFAEFLQALFFMAAGDDSSDAERAVKSMERVAGMLADKTYIAKDLELAENVANGAKMPALTYIIFETGVGPKRDQVRIDIPLFVATRDVPYTGAAFPKLEFDTDFTTPLEATVGGQTYKTQLLCDMDAVVHAEFQNRLPEVITKTLVAAGSKAAATYAIQQGTRNDGVASIISTIATTAYGAATNEADLRTWRTLPKQFQYCRFPTPEDRTVTIRTPAGGGGAQTVTIEPGHVNVLFVKSARNAAPISVTQFKLK